MSSMASDVIYAEKVISELVARMSAQREIRGGLSTRHSRSWISPHQVRGHPGDKRFATSSMRDGLQRHLWEKRTSMAGVASDCRPAGHVNYAQNDIHEV